MTKKVMTKKEKELVLIMREVGAYTHHGDFNMGYSYEFQPDQLEQFAALLEAKIRAEEREKSLRLWMLLDDVDTADDIAKSDDALYRSLCRQAHQKRWDLLTGDEVDAIRARGEK